MIPFCDYLTCTFALDRWDEIKGGCAILADTCGCEILFDDHGVGITYRFDGGGTCRLKQAHHVGMIGWSGGALSACRSAGWLADWLMLVGAGPHRVTRVDATLDVRVDAVPIISSLASRAREGGMYLTRKSIAPGDVQTLLGLDARGALTGSVYLGRPSAKVRALVYDKRHERECRDVPDPGPWLRYEIKIAGDVGVSLHDVWDAAPVFYHYASPALLPLPALVVPWVPHGEGFVMERAPQLVPAQLMRRRLDASPDVRRLIELAVEVGPGGPDLLVRWFAKLVHSEAHRVRSAAAYDAAPAATPAASRK